MARGRRDHYGAGGYGWDGPAVGYYEALAEQQQDQWASADAGAGLLEHDGQTDAFDRTVRQIAEHDPWHALAIEGARATQTCMHGTSAGWYCGACGQVV